MEKLIKQLELAANNSSQDLEDIESVRELVDAANRVIGAYQVMGEINFKEMYERMVEYASIAEFYVEKKS
jgi:hypothetical protein